MKKLIKLSVAGLSLFLLSFTAQSCDTAKETLGKVENKDLGTKLEGGWTLKTIDRTSVSDAFKDKLPTLFFNLKEHKVNGNSGCNTFNGGFTLIGNSFVPTPMASTMMACADDNQEPRLLELLGKKSTLVFNNYTLQFVQNGTVVLEFTPMKR